MKKCKSCQSEIDLKAVKCPFCRTDQRNWFARHTVLSALLALFILGLIGAAKGNKSGTGSSSEITDSGSPVVDSDSGKTEVPTEKPVASPTPISIEQIKLSGTGQQASSKFQLEKGLSIFNMTNTGSGNFSIWLMDDGGNRVELLVNEIGSFDGSKAVNIGNKGEFILDISSDGTWTVTVEQPRLKSAEAKNSFRGISQKTTELFFAAKGLKTVKLTHDGNSNFSVWLLGSGGEKMDLLVNEIGSFDGSKAIRIPADGLYLFDISADGNWAISME